MISSKSWISAGAAMLGAGALICGISFATMGFDFAKLGTVEYVTNTTDVEEKFQHITINANIEDVALVPADDGACKVVCFEPKDDPNKVSVNKDTLIIEKEKKQGWHLFDFGSVTENPKITVYLPDDSYKALLIDTDTGDVDVPADFSFESISIESDTGDASCDASADEGIEIKSNTGDIIITDVSAKELKLTSDTGKMNISDAEISEDVTIRENTGNVSMKNVTCKKFTSKEDSGDLTMTSVRAEEEFNLESDTGDIRFDGCDAETISIKTDTGDVTGTLLSEKVFITDSDTGNIDVAKTTTGGKCEVTTDTGDIKIDIK